MDPRTQQHPQTRAYKEVYTITERGDGRRPIWTKLGVAFVNQDGSLNVVLQALPVSGKLHIRDPKPREDGPVGDGRRNLNAGGNGSTPRPSGPPPADDDIPF